MRISDEIRELQLERLRSLHGIPNKKVRLLEFTVPSLEAM